jgi:GCN5-related N-acetyl-transferase
MPEKAAFFHLQLRFFPYRCEICGLAGNALDWARRSGYKVDIVCPTVRRYVNEHPEYADLEMRS